MADQSDVETALEGIVSAVLYPNGAVGDAPPSALGVPARIYRGWPDSAALDKDLAAGIVNVSIYAPPGPERNVTAYPTDWQVTSTPAPSLSVAVSGSTVTLSGTVGASELVGVRAYGKPYVYPTQSGDTLASIASALAALIAPDGAASASGAVLTLADPAPAAAVGVFSTAVREVKRQEKSFQIVLWCPNPALRDAAASLIDPPLAAMVRFDLPDGSSARLTYSHTVSNDAPEKALLFRRDLFYTVEYPTLETLQIPQVMASLLSLRANGGPALAATAF